MTPETIFGVIVVIAIAIGVASRLWPKARPKELHFRCGRCNARALHTERTIAAWRQKKTKFFCPECHRKWLESRPNQQRQSGSTASNSGRSGCLGVLVFVVLLPTALIAGLAALAVI